MKVNKNLFGSQRRFAAAKSDPNEMFYSLDSKSSFCGFIRNVASLHCGDVSDGFYFFCNVSYCGIENMCKTVFSFREFSVIICIKIKECITYDLSEMRKQ